jgi:hypothetical protein
VAKPPDFPVVDCGEPRVLACLPPKPTCAFPRWADTKPIIPRSEWRDVSWRPLNARIMDQDGRGACVGFSSINAFERAWRVAGGTTREFSPWFLYAQINGGRDAGAVISDALEQLIKGGVCLESEVEQRVYLKRNISAAAYETAKRFRLAEGYALDSFDAIGSAIMMGYSVVYGIMVGNSFTSLDAGGVPGVGGMGGHALHGCGIRKVPAGKHKGKWSVETENSWGEVYGQGGYCWTVEDHFASMERWGFDAFAARAAALDPQDPLNPPTIKSVGRRR